MEHIVSLTILLSFKSSLSFSTGLELVILWKIMVYTDSTCLVFNAGALIVAHCRTLVGAHVPKSMVSPFCHRHEVQDLGSLRAHWESEIPIHRSFKATLPKIYAMHLLGNLFAVWVNRGDRPVGARAEIGLASTYRRAIPNQ